MKNFICILTLFLLVKIGVAMSNRSEKIEKQIDKLINQMTLQEKIGQMSQRNGVSGRENAIEKGMVGSILNEVDPQKIQKAQRIALEKSPNGIPLLFARDVIHGFRTIFPIPIGLAATWNPDILQKAARVSAEEAASIGINWTFAPMIDISRDPRWGRIAESFGEDPYLTSKMAVAMVKGFQTHDLTQPDAIVACAKHFVGYGAVEGGRDYNSVYIPEQSLREVYLEPFKESIDAGVMTLMPAFNDLNGVPSTANKFILKQILRDEWNFQGLVVSDWAAINELITHGYSANKRAAAKVAAEAGVDMEMATALYAENLEDLVERGEIDIKVINEAVRNILRIKFKLGLFKNPFTDASDFPPLVNDNNLALARETAAQSIVMLKNENHILPLKDNIKKMAVIGPLADDQFEQLGTWTFDKVISDTRTPLQALRKTYKNKIEIDYVKGLETSRSKNDKYFNKALVAAEETDLIIVFGGEEAIITGEAHCRANINLPGAQEELITALSKTGKPIVLVIMAGRPLTMGNIIDKVDAILYSFHPGTMGGPAIVDLLSGKRSPSGKLPVTFPKVVGQIPMYYNHKNTGRPPVDSHFVHIDDIPVRAVQTSLGNESHYIDAGYEPQFPFGFGLSYTEFQYSDLNLSSTKINKEDRIKISAKITNKGDVKAAEIVQLYVRDLVASITPPVRELKSFKRISLEPGETKLVEFSLTAEDLSFYNQDMQKVVEPGKFHVWIARDAASGLKGEFEIIE
jgi:beta-glucosidase